MTILFVRCTSRYAFWISKGYLKITHPLTKSKKYYRPKLTILNVKTFSDIKISIIEILPPYNIRNISKIKFLAMYLQKLPLGNPWHVCS